MFRVLFPSIIADLCAWPQPRELLRPLSHVARPHPHDLQLRASPLASPLLAEGARTSCAKQGVWVAKFGRLSSLFPLYFFRPPPPVHPTAALLSAMAADWRPIPRRYRAWTLPTYWPRPWWPAAARRGSTGGTRRATRPRRRRRRPIRRPYRRAP